MVSSLVKEEESSFWKRFQRILLTSVSRHLSCYVFFLISLVFTSLLLTSVAAGLRYFHRYTTLTETDYCSRTYQNNIGHRSFTDALCYPQIDAVYTWVNGSDPEWLKQMLSYRNQSEEMNEKDSATATNRFRDNDELKYSLRSIERFAPWIHKVFIVTNGQIPNWLDTNNPKVEIVTHEQIFQNPNDLPTFSSAAIETNLHRIPGLSDYFVYFNDDVFLGRPVYPYDFYTLEHGQIMYYSWDVPSCAPNCLTESLGDGYCDAACNVESCGFDLGDCKGSPQPPLNESKTPIRVTSRKSSSSKERCNQGCPFLWIGDGSCDKNCNVEECGYDAYDCSTESSQILHRTFVRFFCVDSFSDDLPVVSFIHSSFYSDREYTRENITCLGRVIVNDNSSYVSIDFGDIYRLGYTIKSIELLDDDMVYSSIFHSFFKELVLVWTVEGRKKGVVFSVHCVITAEMIQGGKKQFYLEIMHIPVEKISYTSPLNRFQYDIHDHIYTNNDLFEDTEDTVICDAISEVMENDLVIVYLEEEDTRFFIVNERLEKCWELTDLSGMVERPMDLMYSPQWDRYLPVIHPRVPKLFRGNFSLLFPVGDNSQQVLSVGSYDHVQKAIEGFVMPRKYRRVCYELFEQEAEARGFILTNITLTKVVPFYSPKPLFATSSSIPSRIFDYEEGLHMLSSFEELIGSGVNSKNMKYYSEPILRSVTCSVNTSLFQENVWYRQKMENFTTVNGIPLRDVEISNSTVYQIEKDMIKELRYSVTLDDLRDPIAISIILPSEEVATVMKKQCHTSANRRLSDEDSFMRFIEENLDDIDLTSPVVIKALKKHIGLTNSSSLQAFISRHHSRTRRLGDSYHDSLVYTNLILMKTIGKEERKVPAHMPHFLHRQTLDRIESTIRPYFESTSSHRFRQSNDLQYSFMYFHFLKSFELEKKQAYYDSLWERYLDTDHDGILNANELRTLASIVYKDDVNDENIEKLRNCLSPETETVETYSDLYSEYERVTKRRKFITFDQYRQCSSATKSVESRFHFAPRFTQMRDTPVIFEMIGDDLNQTMIQLNSIRKRRSKFICVNDNVMNMTEEMRNALHEFYESFFPVPSQFEKGTKAEGTKEAIQLNRLGIVIVILGIVGLIVLWVFF